MKTAQLLRVSLFIPNHIRHLSSPLPQSRRVQPCLSTHLIRSGHVRLPPVQAKDFSSGYSHRARRVLHRYGPLTKDETFEVDTTNFLRSGQNGRPAAWLSLLDPYMPARLRSSGRLSEDDSDYEPSLPSTDQLLSFFKMGENNTSTNLLSYLAVHQERWEALAWLLREILETCPSYSSQIIASTSLPQWEMKTHGVWNPPEYQPYSLGSDDKFTALPLDQYLDQGFQRNGFSLRSSHHETVGLVLKTLGQLVILAADRTRTDPIHGLVMSVVLHILGQMHHLDLLPSSLYNYEIHQKISSSGRPPTLYLLSQRIMTVLSDTAWKNHWQGEMAQAKTYGYELPQPRVQPQMPFIGTEIWLDLILWICIQGGWIREGGYIVSYMEMRQDSPSTRWTTIAWEDVCRTKTVKLGMAALLKLQIDKSRTNQSTGIAIANSGVAHIDPGLRTVSAEAIKALMSGLANTVQQSAEHSEEFTFASVWDQVMACNNLLLRSRYNEGWTFVRRLLRKRLEEMLQFHRQVSIHKNTTLDLLLQLKQLHQLGEDPDETSTEQDDSLAPVLGLSLRTLYLLASRNKTVDTLKAFSEAQKIIDTERQYYISTFASWFAAATFKRVPNLQAGEHNLEIAASSLSLPNYISKALLELITDTKNTELGTWLLFNDDIDSGAIKPDWIEEPDLQPVLMRYAVMSGDDQLKTRVLELMAETSSLEKYLHALLQSKIQAGEWDEVELIFETYASRYAISWVPADVLEIAAAILQIASSDTGKDVDRPLSILQDILSGKVHNIGREGEHHGLLHERQLLNQLARMCRTIGGPLASIRPGPGNFRGRAHYRTRISSESFRPLLQAVTSFRGVRAGIDLWEKYVAARSDPSSPPSSGGQTKNEDIGLLLEDPPNDPQKIEPTFSLLRIIVAQLQQDQESSPPQDSHASQRWNEQMAWALQVGKNLGYDEQDLLPGF